jgi:hypothetical protein
MASNTYKSDSGAVFGQSYDFTLDGYSYVMKTVSHSLPTSGIEIKDSSGRFKGGADVADRETMSVEIDAVTGTPPPSQLVVFSLAIHGFTSKYWKIHGLTLKSGNSEGRTYSAEVKQSIASS